MVQSIKLRREPKKDSLSSGAINVITPGVLIMVLLKFYIAFKKDKSGFLMEDEVFVRVIAYKLDCKNCTYFADAGQY